MPDEEKETVEAEVVDEPADKEFVTGQIPILSSEAFMFAKLVAEGKGPTEAYKEVYPEKVVRLKRVSGAAYALARNPRVREQIAIIQEATRLQMIMEAPAAFERIKELSESAKGEKVKLEANLEILDRAGLKPPQRIESIQVGLWGSLSQMDMRSLVRRRLENQ